MSVARVHPRGSEKTFWQIRRGKKNISEFLRRSTQKAAWAWDFVVLKAFIVFSSFLGAMPAFRREKEKGREELLHVFHIKRSYICLAEELLKPAAKSVNRGEMHHFSWVCFLLGALISLFLLFCLMEHY